MTDTEKEKIFEQRFKKHLGCVCRYCDQPIRKASDMVYVKTKRKDDIFYHTWCVDKGAVRFTEVR